MKLELRYTDFDNNRQIRATAKLTSYFSLTGETYVNHRLESCGWIHADILKAWPFLKPLADIHLSDEDGVPMHAVENGWYRANEPNATHLANHLRVPLMTAEWLANLVTSGSISKKVFADFIELQKPRWKAEAEAAKDLIHDLS